MKTGRNEGFYEFNIGSQNDQSHEYTSLMWYLAKKDKKAGIAGMKAEEDVRLEHTESRMRAVDGLCESYFDEMGEYPSGSVLDRMGSLILFDELYDESADKMTKEEYPIMSDRQVETRERKTLLRDSLWHDGRQSNGRRRTYREGKNGEILDSNPRMPDLSHSEYEDADERVDLAEIVRKAKLTDRQKEALWLVYGEDMTQGTAAEEMGVSDRAIRYFIEESIGKVKKVLPKTRH